MMTNHSGPPPVTPARNYLLLDIVRFAFSDTFRSLVITAID